MPPVERAIVRALFVPLFHAGTKLEDDHFAHIHIPHTHKDTHTHTTCVLGTKKFSSILLLVFILLLFSSSFSYSQMTTLKTSSSSSSSFHDVEYRMKAER